MGISDSVYNVDHPTRTISAKVGSNWPKGFWGKAEYAKNDRRDGKSSPWILVRWAKP